jgi:hypothetical protein
MKITKMRYLLLFFIPLLFIINSCKKEEPSLKNYLYYDECQYEIPKGFITTIDSHEHPELFAHIICLYSGTRNIVQSNDTLLITGEGDILLLTIYTLTEDISNSTYNYAPIEELTPNTFQGLFIFEMKENCAEIFSIIKEGNLKIEKESSNYIISIDCIDIIDKELSGQYKGTLRIECVDNLKNLMFLENKYLFSHKQRH